MPGLRNSCVRGMGVARRWAGGMSLLAVMLFTRPASGQTPDFSGTWLPVPEPAEGWQIDTLPLTTAAREWLEAFDPKRFDSTYFCMPYGTPRNTLNTAERPLRILQSGTQLTLLFDGLGDIRRVFVDGRPHPEDPVPAWMGYSIGHWEADTLVVETIAMTSESILDDQGLPHGEGMRLDERISLVATGESELLQFDIRISDPEFYAAPLTATRHFRRAPDAQTSEGSSHCLMDQWRRSLEAYNRTMYQDLQDARTEEQQP